MDNLIIKNAKICFRNFSGREDKFNRAGNRNFCVVVDDHDYAAKLIEDGWNLKEFKPRESEEEPDLYFQVAVSYKVTPPNIYLVDGRKKTLLDEDNISVLDHADIQNIDLVISPYPWDVNGKSGIKAYLKTMYVTIESDPFADDYAFDDEDTPF